ncbi:hypothetical protein MYX77_04720 [Acidobacteriia bacterium AH_259_A11_L15]|nr:hypothetical protein [Acidobacteriia bacterium AH_259_A11_L15]
MLEGYGEPEGRWREEDADWLPQVEDVRPLALIELKGPEGGVPVRW